MNTHLTTTFKREAKKLHANQKHQLKIAIEAIEADPNLGEAKLGDLAGIRVYRFHMLHQLILLAYLYDEYHERLTLVSFAPHENFYKNLKNIIHRH